MRIIARLGGTVHLNGVDNHTVQDLPLVQAGTYTMTAEGARIFIINQGAHMPDGKTILPTAQMEHFGWTIDDRSPIISGKTPTITSPCGRRLPISSPVTVCLTYSFDLSLTKNGTLFHT